ncbi:Outer membrane lipoprotein Omp16 precursor [Candidatus Arcanobacter lacustris]|jgi:peptidoglycan-associated lipoprotein|uniref:Peptidoglycan-associated lipoprotein n=1 Tax=Candidatus Arcanibacter lacustris TaxID=1607817 RepID=A0A0F5MPS8_9RICK|nr:Outer membrane lipoprotein Omp16 precursor [Candidatus Arcanobacter lacustris]
MLRNFVAIVVALGFLSACQTKPVDTAGSAAGGAYAAGSQGDLAANAGDRVLFEFDSSSLNSEAQATLALQAKWLEANPSVTAIVHGHCDERGTVEYNLALGERRANAAKEFLVNSGIDASRLKAHSEGKEQPAVPEHDEDAWRQNRRSVTVVNE